MYKYLFSIIIGIILFVCYNNINKFSIGIPIRYYLYSANMRNQVYGPYEDWDTANQHLDQYRISDMQDYIIVFNDGETYMNAMEGPFLRYTLRIDNGEITTLINNIEFNNLEEAQTFLTNYYTTYRPNFDGQGNDLGDPRYDQLQQYTHDINNNVDLYTQPLNIFDEFNIVVRIYDRLYDNILPNSIVQPLVRMQTEPPDGIVIPEPQRLPPAPMPQPAPMPETEPTTEIHEGIPPVECASAFTRVS